MIKEAIILAGGMGKRLKGVIGDDIPKPMAPVNDRPFLEYLLTYLDRWSVSRVIMAVGYKHKVIEKYFGNHYKDMEIVYSVEDEPLGTGGAVKKALESVKGQDVYVVNGDTYFDANLWKLANFHKAKEVDVCIALRKMGDTSRFGTVKIDQDNRIIEFIEKGTQTGMGFINGGTYIINSKTFLDLKLPNKFSLEIDYFEKYYKKQRIFGVRCYSFFLDIGIPEDYEEATDAFEGLLI